MTVLASLQESFFGRRSESLGETTNPSSPSSAGSSLTLSPTASSSSTFGKLHCFNDWDALESGEALEFIPQEWLESPEHYWMCRVSRKNFVEFTMALEYNAGMTKGSKPVFMLSARRVENNFYISRYESFPTEWTGSEVPSGRYCAVIKATTGFPSAGGVSPPPPATASEGGRRGFELLPASFSSVCSPRSGHFDHPPPSPPLATIHQSLFVQPNCGARVRIVEANLVANDTATSTTSQQQQQPSSPSSASSGSSGCSVDRGVYVWDSRSSKFGKTISGSGGVDSSARSGGSSHDEDPCRSPEKNAAAGNGNGVGISSSSRTAVCADTSVCEGKVAVLSQIPTWDPAKGCLSMAFQRGRVKLSSSKNFILFKEAEAGRQKTPRGRRGGRTAATTGGGVEPSKAVLQFGKQTDNEFALDFVAPIAPLQAFAFALSAFAFEI